MFSIIIPLYNKENEIEKTIQSVLNQKNADYEIIIINDGSTDNSMKIVNSISDSRIRIIEKNNEGVSITRNRGAKEARFEYVAFLDGDDLWHPNYLFEMKSLINNYPNEKIFASNYFFIKNKQIIEPNMKVEIKENDHSYLNYIKSFETSRVSPFMPSSVIIHKSLFNHYCFNPSLVAGEDLFLWIQLAIENKIVYYNKRLMSYNHDVVSERAIGHLRKKENHFVFHLNIFEEEEKNNKELKKLLDYLRISYIKPYLLIYPKEAREIISIVNKSNMDIMHKLFYHRLFTNILIKFYKKKNVMFLKKILNKCANKT